MSRDQCIQNAASGTSSDILPSSVLPTKTPSSPQTRGPGGGTGSVQKADGSGLLQACRVAVRGVLGTAWARTGCAGKAGVPFATGATGCLERLKDSATAPAWRDHAAPPCGVEIIFMASPYGIVSYTILSVLRVAAIGPATYLKIRFLAENGFKCHENTVPDGVLVSRKACPEGCLPGFCLWQVQNERSRGSNAQERCPVRCFCISRAPC